MSQLINRVNNQGLRALIFLLLALLLSACSQPPQTHTLNGHTMGTVWTVKLADMPSGITTSSLNADIRELLEMVNRQMSTYDPESHISRYNRSEAGSEHVLPPDFQKVLVSALYWAEISEGAYDPTVGPLVNVWGFGADGRQDTRPEKSALAKAKERVGWQKLQWDRNEAILTQTGNSYLDLSSIAKGFAVDRIAEYLEFRGIRSYLVDIGGDLRAGDKKPHGSPWRIAVERPLPGTREIHRVLELNNLALASSGDYRNFFQDEGRQFSHIIDPRTGEPVNHGLASVSVLHEKSMQADVLATLLTVLGPQEGREFAQQHDLAVLLISRNQSDATQTGFVEFMTSRFARYLNTESP